MVRVKVSTVGQGGFELPPAKVSYSVPESRLLRLPLHATPAVLGSYMFRSGRGYAIRKSAEASLVYGVDLRAWLEDAGATLASVTIELTRGVSASDAFFQGTVIGALVSGLRVMEGASNSCTFRFTCTDGQSDTVTIYFEKG